MALLTVRQRALALIEALLEDRESYEGGTDYDLAFREQWPRKPEWHPGHRSSRMSLGRNLRRKSFGYSDYRYSLRDRGWPYANRGYDRRKKAYDRAMAKFGQVTGGGGI